MATRRQAREWALQALVQLDLNPVPDTEAALAAFWEQLRELEAERRAEDARTPKVFDTDPADDAAVRDLEKAKAFAGERIRGVRADLDEVDRTLESRLRNWALYRLGTVERNVLRLGIWELTHCADIPAPIVINECVDLAKFFSETKSGRFVNGILDKFAKDLKAEQSAGTFVPEA